MRTTALIKQIQRDAPKWSSEDIRELINEVQRYVYSNPISQMRMYDTSTGSDPILNTTSGTYEYSIGTSNGFSYDASGVYVVYTSLTDIDGSKVSVDIIPATETDAAKVRFIDTDPGTSTYYVWAFRKPPEITSSSVQLTIPPDYHLTLVKKGVMGLIETSDSGKSSQWEEFEVFYKKKFLSSMNKNSRGNKGSYIVKPQGF